MLNNGFDPKAWKIPPEVSDVFGGREPTILPILGDINRSSIDEAASTLSAIKSESALLVVIDSGGGSQDGMRIANLISQLDVPKAALVIGRAGSMAAVILMSLPKENRFAFHGTMFLIHQGKTTMPVEGKIDVTAEMIGGMSRGLAHQKLSIAWESSHDFQMVLNKQIAANLGETVEIGGERIPVEDFVRCDEWLSEQQAKRIGLIETIVGNF